MRDDTIIFQESQGAHQGDTDGRVKVAGLGGEKNTGNDRVEDEVENNRALDPPRIMNEENQRQPVYEKLDAGKLAEPLDAGGRILSEGLEAEVEDGVIGRDEHSDQEQFSLRDEQAEDRAGDRGSSHDSEGGKPPESD